MVVAVLAKPEMVEQNAMDDLDFAVADRTTTTAPVVVDSHGFAMPVGMKMTSSRVVG